jgi:transposase
VVNFIDKDPFSGNVFIFVNKRRDRIKLLLWDSDGFWIFYKRLEKGTFQVPAINLSNDSLELSYEQLLMILKGFDLSDVKKRPRYKRTFC